MLLLSLFTLFVLLATPVDARFCTFTGCADGTQCQCVPFFSTCDVTNDKTGLCVMTESGTWITVAGVLLLIALLLFAIICICCCGCCKCRRRTEIVHVQQPYDRVK